MTKAAPRVLTAAEIDPFLKWAGGKRWLVEKVAKLVPEIRDTSGTYFEPFLGGGAMFFSLKPKKAVLNDLNAELINVYRAIKREPDEIEKLLRRCHRQHSEDFYYEVRQTVPKAPLKAAVRFLYLNRTCWNGLYRVNRKGEFNVPIGTKVNVVLPTDDFHEIKRRLANATLHSKDFSAIVKLARRGDTVFADPPYTVNHNLNGFLKYNEKLFSWEDQERLHKCVLAAARRGAFTIVSNADHSSIRNLYREKEFILRTIRRFSKLSGTNDGRKEITELLITGRAK